jgi:hypothetical protein
MEMKGENIKMARFIIEVPHEAEPGACIRAVKTFLNTGSHFLSNADWGCYDGDHKAWLVLELDSKQEALSVIPPGFKSNAKIVQLNKFTLQDLDNMSKHHQGAR